MSGILSKEFILSEIKRLAFENGGTAIGRERFARVTGIRNADIEKHWIRWGDAVQEAGFEPNQLQSAIEDDALIQNLISLIRELGHFPVRNEFRMKARHSPGFPSANTFARLAGGMGPRLAAKLRHYCTCHIGYADVLLLLPAMSESRSKQPNGVERSAVEFGFVYLMKSGKYYKIGWSNHAGRREYELAIQLPEALKTVHRIQTDDPPGIEEYWHKRFAAKRKNGEWFDLDAADIAAFRRRRFM